jgi:hypothetical protein
MSGRSLQANRINDVIDMMATVKHLNEALFLAAGSMVNTAPDTCNALQSVINEVENKLHIITDRLDEVREDLA